MPRATMTFHPHLSLAAATLLLICTSSHADNCDAIQSQIDAKIRASGVMNFTLTTVDVGVQVTGKTVGTCALGLKKIVYALDGSGSNASAAAPSANRVQAAKKNSVITECRDGSVSVGKDCKP